MSFSKELVGAAARVSDSRDCGPQGRCLGGLGKLQQEQLWTSTPHTRWRELMQGGKELSPKWCFGVGAHFPQDHPEPKLPPKKGCLVQALDSAV